MDPIHPILPQPVHIPPVRPSTGVGKINRDAGRDGGAGRQAKRDAERRRRDSRHEAGGEDEAAPGVDIVA